MGRSYQFECSKCGYRVKVSGCADRGHNFFVQTIVCRDCKKLYDAVTKVRVSENPAQKTRLPLQPGVFPGKLVRTKELTTHPPTFEVAANRLRQAGGRHAKWVNFKLRCPVSPLHRVEPWNEPDRCPKCRTYLERNALPYRLWD